jgi:hypothetical protein
VLAKISLPKLTIIFAGVILFAGIISCLWFIFLGTTQVAVSTRAITEVSRYQEIRAGYEDSLLIQHFPESLPPEATDVQIEYLPKFLQGGGYFKLSYKLPLEQINELHTRFNGTARYKYREGDVNHLTGNLPDDVPRPSFQMSASTKEDSFETYEVFILDIQAARGAESEWNHGYSYGVAIDDTAWRVVYWNEYW